MRCSLTTLVLAGLALGLAGNSPARPDDFEINWWTLDGGGGGGAGGAFTLTGTIGQPDAGTMSGGAFELSSGFWVSSLAAPAICRGDCDCDGRVAFSDIDYFVAAIPDNQAAWAALYAARHGGAAPPCSFENCDCTGDGHVNFTDIDPFVALIPSICP